MEGVDDELDGNEAEDNGEAVVEVDELLEKTINEEEARRSPSSAKTFAANTM